jgi:carboxyl-terminal processing protease
MREPSGGSTGQPRSSDCRAAAEQRVCTLRTRYADGRDFVGTGIQPHILVAPTVADFRLGKDMVLDAAVPIALGVTATLVLDS